MKAVFVIVFVVVGAALLVYGVVFHKRAVVYDEEVQIEAPPLTETPELGGFDDTGAFGGLPPDTPPETITVVEEKEALETEPHLVLEITRGGVVRLADGRIKRTYSGAEAPPSVCPT